MSIELPVATRLRRDMTEKLLKATLNPNTHIYQCVCKILSKYSKRFKSYRHFSTFFTNRPGQNLHILSGNNIKCSIIGHSVKFNFKFQLTFLGSCNYVHDLCVTHKSTVARTVMCRQDGRGRFPVLLDDHSKCRTISQRKSQLS